MAKDYETIDDAIREWIGRQKMFFVSTAPLAREGSINCSPKGMDTFRVTGPREICYMDLTGSGAETIAHLRENGRVTIMMCALEGAPRIFRFYGVGRVARAGTPEFDDKARLFSQTVGDRSIIVVDVQRIRDSCGYGVPEYRHVRDRDHLAKWMDAKGEQGITDYWAKENRQSLDGLPALDS